MMYSASILPSFITATLTINRVSAQPGCCSAWFFAPKDAVITKLKSTLIIPPLSQGQGTHFVWSGLENHPGSFVYQSVIGDQQLPGYWSFATWYGPDTLISTKSTPEAAPSISSSEVELMKVPFLPATPAFNKPLPKIAEIFKNVLALLEVRLSKTHSEIDESPQRNAWSQVGSYYESPSPAQQVFEGDTLTTMLYLLQTPDSSSWMTAYTLSPGPISTAAGFGAKSSTIYSQLHYQSIEGGLPNVIFEIEMQENKATWDFGPVVWEDVYIESNSSEAGWCEVGKLGEWAFEVKISEPRRGVLDNGEGTWCWIEKIVFVSPGDEK